MENRRRQIVALLLMLFLLIASAPIIGTVSNPALTGSSDNGAKLTGVIFDEGVDADDDETFDYLVVGVEVNVSDAGFYEVQVKGLLDSDLNYINVYSSTYSSLDVGLRVLNVSLNGPDIYVSGLNPLYVNYIEMWGGKYEYERNYNDSMENVLLSREYSYTEFDPPAAVLTGEIYDRGVDTDSDGTFNYLEIGVEVNVTKSGNYEVYVSELLDAYGNWIEVWGSEYGYLGVGLGVLNVSLSGFRIRASRLNASSVNSISLFADYYSSIENVPLSREYLYTEFDAPAVLTGVISDEGLDTDTDGTFDLLEIGVEINVSDPGDYWIEISGLLDSDFNHIEAYASKSVSLEAGLKVVYLSMEGPRIYLSRRNPRYVNHISLWFWEEEYWDKAYWDEQSDVSLSRQYNYTEFDAPEAMLTGKIYDRGLDTDSDGAFNYLEVSVEINVTKPGNYQVYVSGLLSVVEDQYDTYEYYIDVWGSKSDYFDVGLGMLNVSLYGPTIYASRHDATHVSWISLHADYPTYLHDVPLSREYLYTEFDSPALLTGVIFDQGVDTDADGSFDYLEVGVQVNVTDPDTYVLYLSGLLGTNYGYQNDTEKEKHYISVWDSKTLYLDVGVQTVNLYLYGPRIYRSHYNPVEVSSISLHDKQYTYYDTIQNVPLSKQYSYTEFDAPFVEVETEFVVYPDGRVAVEGALKYTNMFPEYTGPATQGFFNLTANGETTQASAGLTLTVPPEEASEFPFNSTTAEILAEYSDGLLDLGINSTMILPSIANSVYPYNATDGTVVATYSEGILNIEAEGNTTLLGLASQQFPLDTTDIIVVGTYSPYTLDGTITFSILDDFTFDDVDVDFKGNQTDFTLNGTVHIVFNVPLGDFIIRDEAELIEKIDQLKSDLLGEEGIVWNMTGGLSNVTNLDIDYALNGIGADITFRMDVHGDFVRSLAYVMSGGRNEMLLYPVLDEAYQSVQSGSFDIRYSHTTLEASMKLTFSYDLKRLIDYILTPPTGTTPYVVAGYGMSPTLWLGDVVMVEEVSDASDIKADPDGDIIAFYSPYDQRYIVIHRAINKTQVDGIWYFQTKGDANYSPDNWTGNNTYNGMVSENYLIGNVSSRIPFLGYLLSYPYSPYYYQYYYPYLQSTVALRMSLSKAVFSSVQSMSVQLSYSSVEKRFDFQLTLVDKLKALADEITLILPETLPPETPPELKSFVESLLNTTYASVSTAQASLSYEDGTADLEATATIEGDLNAELNYLKDLYFQLAVAQYSDYNMTIPWQAAFINQTKIDVSNLRITAKLDETSFEGRIEGLTLKTPIDAINATQFKLERFFNLTAPQHSWQREFPEQNQKLEITIEGGSNATHIITLFRPPTVPEPNLAAPSGKSMVWFNQTLSSLKDLVFKIELRPTGNLTVATTPVSGEIFVNGTSWGSAPQSQVVDVGTYNVSFGPVAGYYTPAWQLVTVEKDAETAVTGVYELITGTLTVTTTPVSAEVFVNGTSWGIAPQSKVIQTGTYIVTFSGVEGYYTPADQVTSVHENVETIIEGVYESIPGMVVTEITNPELVNATNPFVVNAIEDAATSLIISEISDPITVIVKNVTEPEDVDPPPGTWEVLGSYVQITVNDTDITVNVTIRIYYTLEQLEASGLDESTLEIRFWNATSGEWESVESHVDTDEHFVWANIDHFSLWALMGQPPSLIWTQPQFLAMIGIAVAVIAIVTVFLVIRKRRPRYLEQESA